MTTMCCVPVARDQTRKDESSKVILRGGRLKIQLLGKRLASRACMQRLGDVLQRQHRLHLSTTLSSMPACRLFPAHRRRTVGAHTSRSVYSAISRVASRECHSTCPHLTYASYVSNTNLDQHTFVFTCGGTGGHITPALAVAQELKTTLPTCKVTTEPGHKAMFSNRIREAVILENSKCDRWRR